MRNVLWKPFFNSFGIILAWAAVGIAASGCDPVISGLNKNLDGTVVSASNGLTWKEGRITRSLPVTALWGAPGAGTTNQTIAFFSDPGCQVAYGAPIDLQSTTATALHGWHTG